MKRVLILGALLVASALIAQQVFKVPQGGTGNNSIGTDSHLCSDSTGKMVVTCGPGPTSTVTPTPTVTPTAPTPTPACASPADLLFSKVATVPMNTLLPPALVLFSEPFTSDTGQLTKYTNTTGATFTFGGGQLTVDNTSGAAREDIVKEGADLTMPQVFAQIDVVSHTGSATGYDNIGIGIVKDQSNFVTGFYDRVAHLVKIQTTISGVGALGASVSRTLTPPYKLGFSLVGNSSCVYVDTGGGWTFVAGYGIPAGTINFRTTSLTGWRPGFTISSPTNSTWVFDNFDAGRHGGVGIRDIAIVTNEDGTPYFSGNNVYISASVPDGNGGGNEGVFTVDLTTYALTQTAVIMVNRSGTIQSDTAGHIIYYGNGDRRHVISTWGNGFGGALEVWHQLVTGEDILNGSHVLSGMAILNLPHPTGGGGVYDPFLIKDGSTWHMAYTFTENTSFSGSPFYPVAAASSDLSTWVLDGADSSQRPYENTRIMPFNGAYYVTAGGPNQARAYDIHINFRGTLKATMDGGGVTQPGAMIFSTGSKYVMFSFDGVKSFPGVTAGFTWGRMIVQESGSCINPTPTITPGGPTLTPTNTPTITPTFTVTPTDTPTNTPTLTPTQTPTSLATNTPTNTPTVTPTPTTGPFDLVRLAQVVTTSTASSVDFSSIPATYTNLLVEINARDTNATATVTDFIKFNNDGTAGDYATGGYLFGSGSAASSGTLTTSGTKGVQVFNITGASSTANYSGSCRVIIPNYAGTTFYKKAVAHCGFTSTASDQVIVTSATWKNTAAVNQLTFTAATAFVDGSTFTLYGMK